MSSSETLEVNFDGLIGPSHNYGGMSDGNLASAEQCRRRLQSARGSAAGLEKMRMLVRAGFVQGVLPPLERPNLGFLLDAGFQRQPGSAGMIEAARQDRTPSLLKAAYSASALCGRQMPRRFRHPQIRWIGALHLTAANLSSMLHRSIEHPETTREPC